MLPPLKLLSQRSSVRKKQCEIRQKSQNKIAERKLRNHIFSFPET